MGRVLKQANRNGYLRVILSKSGIPKHINVHRLVAEYFVMNPENKEYVDGLYQKDIAKKYSVSQTFVSAIVRGKSWHFSEDKNLTNILDYFWNN